MVVRDALGEAKNVREMGIYSYAAGDGDDVTHKGLFHESSGHPFHPDRQGYGLKTAAKVFQAFLTKDDQDYMLPI